MPPFIGFMPAMTSTGRARLYSSFFELVNRKNRLTDPGGPMRMPILSEFFGRRPPATASVLIWAEHRGKAPSGAAIAGFGLVVQEFSSLSLAGPSTEVLNQNHARIMD
jgi:hypothetical protein